MGDETFADAWQFIVRHFSELCPSFRTTRDVAKVDQLMALCDMLEQQIDAASNKQTGLLNALIVQVRRFEVAILARYPPFPFFLNPQRAPDPWVPLMQPVHPMTAVARVIAG